jgi:hypothetical protein
MVRVQGIKIHTVEPLSSQKAFLETIQLVVAGTTVDDPDQLKVDAPRGCPNRFQVVVHETNDQ